MVGNLMDGLFRQDQLTLWHLSHALPAKQGWKITPATFAIWFAMNYNESAQLDTFITNSNYMFNMILSILTNYP